jgi:uncharacterized membrane protein
MNIVVKTLFSHNATSLLLLCLVPHSNAVTWHKNYRVLSLMLGVLVNDFRSLCYKLLDL